MAGLERLLKGLLRYQAGLKPQFYKRLADIKKDPSTLKGLMFSCMDARVNVSRLLASDLGEAFEVRNAGNFIPHHSTVSQTSISTEPGALELACVSNNVPDVVVFGHSDCKAMIGLHDMAGSTVCVDDSPLMMWLQRHGSDALKKYQEMVKKGGPITFKEAHQSFEANIDPSNLLAPHDKLSQINTLQQLENISSYPFLTERLLSGSLRTHAVWLDLAGAHVYVFNRKQKKFDEVTDSNINDFV